MTINKPTLLTTFILTTAILAAATKTNAAKHKKPLGVKTENNNKRPCSLNERATAS